MYEKEISLGIPEENKFIFPNNPEKPSFHNPEFISEKSKVEIRPSISIPIEENPQKFQYHIDKSQYDINEITNETILKKEEELEKEYIGVRERCIDFINKLKSQKLDIMGQNRLFEIQNQFKNLDFNSDSINKSVEEIKELHKGLNDLLLKDKDLIDRIKDLENRLELIQSEIKRLAREYESLYESHFSGLHGTSADFRVEKTTLSLEQNLGGKIVIGSPLILDDGRCVYDIENIVDNKTYRIVLNERIPACDNDGIVLTLGYGVNETFDKDNHSKIVEIEGTVNHIDHTNQIKVISLVEEREKIKEEISELKSSK